MSNTVDLEFNVPEIQCPECKNKVYPVPTGEKDEVAPNTFDYILKCPKCGHEFIYRLDKPKKM